ncbi:putative PRP19-non-snRNP spliceosome component required for DNA repair [Meira miltonrushii]|uniref:Pre-mRNA-processing factor 19 n=1 Tax=Meira miltonrushii TaxID=1280837 RepID=A0A316V665_9BASI|nr:putative PRP19-non-snRNP spliceosome component required for DNA repair [Meira miltonrushii]PWN32744.1 putative PRP19-non-snRNP spliceosome component required for DNA repair [Meira miltonrushii]
MFCAISGEPPVTPVISKKSGLVYEQRLILKYIQENGKDPITGDTLTEDDLIEIKANPKTVAPRPPSHSSIPSLLSTLQNEIDASVLETFTLKKAYDSVRQELAHALYANDSANRVIARLLWERDEARTALASLRDSMGQNGATGRDAEMTDANNASTSEIRGMPGSYIATIDETSATLSSTRKAKMKRKPEGYTQASSVSQFAQLESVPSLHTTRSPGVTALDVSLDGDLLLTGGKDKQVQVYRRSTGKTIATLKGHSDAINKVLFVRSLVGVEFGNISENGEVPEWAVSASADHSVHVWKADGNEKNAYSLAHSITSFKKAITGLAVHPSGLYFAAASEDGTIGFFDVSSGERLLQIEASHQYTSLDIHPDGTLLAAGTSSGSVVIYDVKTGQESASFSSESSTSVSSLNFSENGYLLASATSSMVEIWDLRKLSKSGTIAVEAADAKGNPLPITVQFDPSAQFLAVVGSDVRIYANKTWQLLWSSNDAHSAPITDCKWSWDKGALFTSSLDRSVRSFAPQQS